MKKAIILLLCAALTLGLAACGEAAVEDSAAPSADVSAEPAPVESAAPGESAPEETPDGEAGLLDTAKEYEGKPVEDLIAAIGEPVSPATTPPAASAKVRTATSITTALPSTPTGMTPARPSAMWSDLSPESEDFIWTRQKGRS